MKRALCLAVLGVVSLGLVGCRASAEVDDTDTASSGHTEYKKTTVTSPSGSHTETKTEVKKSTY
jgi:hypothetical protein